MRTGARSRFEEIYPKDTDRKLLQRMYDLLGGANKQSLLQHFGQGAERLELLHKAFILEYSSSK